MALARKCDRCGKLYEQYPSNNENNVWNGVALVRRTMNNGFCDSDRPMDLCPVCMITLEKYLNNEALDQKEESSNVEN